MGQASGYIGCKKCGESIEARAAVATEVESFYGDGTSAGMFTAHFCNQQCATEFKALNLAPVFEVEIPEPTPEEVERRELKAVVTLHDPTRLKASVG